MDERIGPPNEFGGCGYNYGPYQCRKQPVVSHFMFSDTDEDGYHKGAFSCDRHRPYVPMDQVLRFHSVGLYCQDPESLWNYEFNECVIPLTVLELKLLGTTDLGKDIDEEFAANPERFRGESSS
jgi:hypothetical protein